ncbi:FAD-dependent oxidoreductase [Saccharomonospora sp. NPDC006951]
MSEHPVNTGKEATTCAIIGAGPAGMVLGLLLARAGVEVTVLEKHDDFLRDFRGDTVHPSTLQLLDELGLGDRFAALPQSKLEEIAFPDGDEGLVAIGDLRRLNVRHPYIAITPQWDLLNLLTEAAEKEPTFTLRRNTEVTGLIVNGGVGGVGGVVEGVRYRERQGGTGELRADLTVACDGRWSIARQQAGLRPKELPVPIDAWWFKLPQHEGEESASLTPSARDGRFAIVIPRSGYYQIAYIAKKGIDASLRARGIEHFRKEVAAVRPELADRVDRLGSMDDVKHLDVRLNRLNRWHTEGLLCIGDAAHAMSPIGGVGINLAVQDAVAAATVLAAPLRKGAVTSSHLAKVRRRRLLPTIAVQTLQRVLHKAVAEPIVEGRRTGPPKPVIKLMRRFPKASFIPAYLIGIGLRPEHAPAFARRPERDS